MSIHILPTLTTPNRTRLESRTGMTINIQGQLVAKSTITALSHRMDLNLRPVGITTIPHIDNPTPPAAA